MSRRGAASNWQLDEQPSPEVVLPSSHCSPGSIVLLPQPGGESSSPPPPVSPTVHATNERPRSVAKEEMRMVLRKLYTPRAYRNLARAVRRVPPPLGE